jgi:hypothetical protein
LEEARPWQGVRWKWCGNYALLTHRSFLFGSCPSSPPSKAIFLTGQQKPIVGLALIKRFPKGSKRSKKK